MKSKHLSQYCAGLTDTVIIRIFISLEAGSQKNKQTKNKDKYIPGEIYNTIPVATLRIHYVNRDQIKSNQIKFICDKKEHNATHTKTKQICDVDD